MSRWFFVTAAAIGALVGAPPARGQNYVEEFRLAVHPANPPTPAMAYHFLPDVTEQVPGNAAIFYLQAAQLMAQVRADVSGKDDDDTIRRWLTTPVAELPLSDVKSLLDRYVTTMAQYRLASRRESCDFEPPFRSEGFRTLLPYLNDAQALAQLACLSARVKMAGGDFAGAVNDLSLPFAHAQHLGRQPFSIHLLVAAAVNNLALQQVRDMGTLKDSPNLYWALGTLPRPVLDARRAMQMERAGAEFSIPELQHARDGTLTPQQWRRMIDVLAEMGGQPGGTLAPRSAGPRGHLTATLQAVKDYPVARQHLKDAGMPPARVDAMSASQVLGLYHVTQLDRRMHDLEKGLTLPYWQGMPFIRRTEQEIGLDGNPAPDRGGPMGVLVPRIGDVYTSVTRADRALALARAVEAIRAYAAAQSGVLPVQLDDLADLPAPLDPMTGKPFLYALQGDHVTLDAPHAPAAGRSNTGMRAVITIVK